MEHYSVSTFEKPMEHLALPDWNCRVNKLRSLANTRRDDAFAIRHSGRTLRNQAKIETQWGEKESSEALADRVSELQRWRDFMQKTFERIQREINLLRDEKSSTEYELETMQGPLSIIGECLNMRDCRLGAELTYDDADTEIRNELALAENNQRLLAAKCQKACEKLMRLESVSFRLDQEIKNKSEALVLDTNQLNLNRFSGNITLKTDSTRIPPDSYSYNSWLEQTRSVKELAENELADTYAIREALFVAREKARNMLISQQDRTEHAIRKRIFETQRARNELEWQKAKMTEAMDRADCEVKALEQALRDTADNLKLAETRLENRANRSGVELCLDAAYDQLCAEVRKLREIRSRLLDKIKETTISLNGLTEHTKRIDTDLENKQHSMMTDIRALDLRSRLKASESVKKDIPSVQTERNIALTRMEKEIPPE